MGLKNAIQNIMNNKVSFALVAVCITGIVGLLAMTIGIYRYDTIFIFDYLPPNHTRSAVFWLPYYIAERGTRYYYSADIGVLTIVGLPRLSGGARAVIGFNFLGKHILITPGYLFVLTILYWILVAVILTGMTCLPIFRRNHIDLGHEIAGSD